MASQTCARPADTGNDICMGNNIVTVEKLYEKQHTDCLYEWGAHTHQFSRPQTYAFQHEYIDSIVHCMLSFWNMFFFPCPPHFFHSIISFM